ncbi:MAG TPA: hypothetical protein VKE69_03945 [Planctomycetota bacterium]|nr:hypothetical protein [Planctomycetota bacterium]
MIATPLPLLLALVLPAPQAAAPSAAPAAAARPIEQVFPADAVFAVWMRDASPIRDALLGKGPLHDSPEMQRLLAAIEFAPEKLSADFEKDSGIALAKVLGPVEGPAGFAFFAPADLDAEKPPVVFLMGYRAGEEADAAFAKLLDSLMEKNSAREPRRTEEEFEGAKLWTISRKGHAPPKEGAPEPPRDEFYVARTKDSVLVASERDPMQRSLVAMHGKPTPTISTRDDFKAGAKRLGPADSVVFSVNFEQVWKLVDESSENPMMIAGLRALGFRSITGFTFGAGLAPGSLETRAFLAAPGARTGLLQIFSSPPRDLDLGPFATADATSAAVLHLDPTALLAEVERIVGSLNPGPKEPLEIKVNGADLRKDLIELLVPPFRSVGLPGSSGHPLDEQALLTFGCKDEARVEQAILKALSSETGESAVEAEEYLGHKIHKLPSPMGPGADDEEEDEDSPGPARGIHPCFAVAGGHLLLSVTGIDAIRAGLRVLGKDVKLLPSTPEFRRATQGLPDRRFGLVYSKLGPSLEAVAKLLRDNQGAPFPPFAMVPTPVRGALAEILGALGKRYESSASSLSADDQGFTFAGRVVERREDKKEMEKERK